MIGGNEMKGKKLKTIISKIDFKKAQPFILLTVIFTVLGLPTATSHSIQMPSFSA